MPLLSSWDSSHRLDTRACQLWNMLVDNRDLPEKVKKAIADRANTMVVKLPPATSHTGGSR